MSAREGYRLPTCQEAKALRLTVVEFNRCELPGVLYSVWGCSVDEQAKPTESGLSYFRCDEPDWTMIATERWEGEYGGRRFVFALCHCHYCNHSNRIGVPLKPVGAE